MVRCIDELVPVRKIRITGGEPLLRRGLPLFIRKLRRLLPPAEIAMTTNGTLLERYAFPLRRAGLDAINVSLDVPTSDGFLALTGRDLLPSVMRGLAAAQIAGFSRLKINTVLLRNHNGDRLLALVELARRHSCEIRFIELMPLGAASDLFQEEYLPAGEALARLGQTYTLVRTLQRNGTATRYLFRDGTSLFIVGFIESISHPFCTSCDRVRLDSYGRLFSCLRATGSLDLASISAGNRSAADRRAISIFLQSKRAPGRSWPKRDMAGIGG